MVTAQTRITEKHRITRYCSRSTGTAIGGRKPCAPSKRITGSKADIVRKYINNNDNERPSKVAAMTLKRLNQSSSYLKRSSMETGKVVTSGTNQAAAR